MRTDLCINIEVGSVAPYVVESILIGIIRVPRQAEICCWCCTGPAAVGCSTTCCGRCCSCIHKQLQMVQLHSITLAGKKALRTAVDGVKTFTISGVRGIPVPLVVTQLKVENDQGFGRVTHKPQL